MEKGKMMSQASCYVLTCLFEKCLGPGGFLLQRLSVCCAVLCCGEASCKGGFRGWAALTLLARLSYNGHGGAVCI